MHTYSQPIDTIADKNVDICQYALQAPLLVSV